MSNSLAVIPSKVGEAIIEYDEEAYIQEALQCLIELHGSYNGQDERLVRHMASLQRSVAIADKQLYIPNQHLQKTGANGWQPSTWFRIRESAIAQIMKIRKDLGMDLMTRKPGAKGKEAEGSFFSITQKDKDSVFVKRS